MALLTHNGETEAAINYRLGVKIGADMADTYPPKMRLSRAIRLHLQQLNKSIRLGPYELDYRQGLSVGWLRKRVS